MVMVKNPGSAVTALVLLATTDPASAECTREGLVAAANTYIQAQVAGSVDGLKLSPTNFTYQENNVKADVKRGLLSQGLKLDYNRTAADTVACASYTLLLSTTGTKPWVIGTQIRHHSDDTSIIAMIDTIAATTGDLFFNAPKTLSYLRAQDWSPIEPASRRPSRETLRKYGDGYLDMWTDRNAAGSMQWGSDCERVEGSSFVKPCGVQLPRGGSRTPNGNRRYVIDDVVGSVDVLCSFDSLGDMPDSHEIRVVDGQVKYVHTITVLN